MAIITFFFKVWWRQYSFKYLDSNRFEKQINNIILIVHTIPRVQSVGYMLQWSVKLEKLILYPVVYRHYKFMEFLLQIESQLALFIESRKFWNSLHSLCLVVCIKRAKSLFDLFQDQSRIIPKNLSYIFIDVQCFSFLTIIFLVEGWG